MALNKTANYALSRDDKARTFIVYKPRIAGQIARTAAERGIPFTFCTRTDVKGVTLLLFDVRRAIDKLIVQYGGRAALTFAKELEKQGDELNLGVE